MGEQKNLFLAIGLSVAIIVIFQILFPQQTAMTPPAKNEVEQLQPATSIDDIQTASKEIKSMISNRSIRIFRGQKLQGCVLSLSSDESEHARKFSVQTQRQ